MIFFKFCFLRKVFAFVFIIGNISFVSCQIVYKSLYTDFGIENYTINTNRALGSTSASADVASGSASYLIPIELPAGTNGGVPNLSVSYNSQGILGFLGYGWSLNGLSNITRGLRSVFHDSIAGPVSVSVNDRFLLDGQRLNNTSGIYGQSGCEYNKEMTDFSKTISYGNFGTGPLWFKVTTKDGIIVEYGKTQDSRFLNANNSEVLVWNISKMIWPDSNYVEFKYENIGREHRIKEINYTGNSLANLVPYNKVKFEYNQSAFSRKTYEGGSLIERNSLLEKIIISTENNILFKTYEFAFAHDNVNEYLVEISEKGSDGSLLNPLIFNYGEYATDEISGNASGFTNNQNTDIFTGDYDGDGLTDMALVNKEILSGGYVFYRNFTAFRNNPVNNSFIIKQNKTIASLSSIANAGNKYNFFTSDYTGDGADDLVYFAVSDAVTFLEVHNATIHSFSNEMNTMTEINISRPSDEYKFVTIGNKYLLTSDFNGDGITDIIYILRNASFAYKAYIYYGGLSTQFTEISISGSATYHAISNWGAKDINAVDFDGDGKFELMVTKGNYSEIFSFFTAYACTSLHAAGYPTEYHLIYPGDFNGDRKTDLLTRAGLVSGPWSISYSTGTVWQENAFTFAINPQINADYAGTILYIADLNGDGKQDIFKGRTNNNSFYHAYYSRGGDFHLSQAAWPYAESAYLAGSGDFNGDGRSDMLIKTSPTSSIDGVVFNKFGQNFLLRKSKNGYGAKVEWQYRRLTEVTNTYMRTGTTTHPLNTLGSPMYVVHNLMKENQPATRYEYRNLRLHKGGRGFLGFGKITKYSPATNFYEETDYQTSTGSYVHMPAVIKYREGTNLLQQKTFTNVVTQLNTGNYNRIFYHRVSATLDQNFFEGRTISEISNVDNYGNTTSSTLDVNGIETVNNSYMYEAFASHVPNKVTEHTATKTRTGQTPYVTTNTYDYNAKGQMTEMVSFAGLPKAVKTQYFYNLLGNQDSTAISAVDISTRHSKSVFDSKGRYPILSRNTLGQVSTISEYDIRWAKPKVSTGIDGLTTTHNYDAFGRVVSVTMPQGYTIQTVYSWEFSFPERYAITTVHPGMPDNKVSYDRTSRPLKTLTYGQNGEQIFTVTTYDSKGRLSTTTKPYKSGDTPFVTTMVYDEYDRVTSQTNPHTTTQYSYTYNGGQLTTTTTQVIPAGNQVSSTVVDATGKIVSSVDNGGTLQYSYHSSGQMATVTQAGTALVSHTYDEYARKLTTTDVNAGIYRYQTDALGQILSEVNPLGHTTAMTFNKLGQLMTKVGTEGTTSYQYFASGSGASVNQLQSITGHSGDSENMMYDPYGRLSSHNHIVDGVTFNKTYGYNIYDQVTSESYTGGLTVSYTRNADGYIQNIVSQGNNTNTIFSNPVRDANLLPTSYTLGNGVSVQKTYNQHFPTGLQAGSFVMAYTWDYASGNLMSRTLHNQSESFQYDHLSRLTHSTHPASAITVSYQASGNILSKTDAGPLYEYDASRIHALRCIPSPAYTNNISQSAQNIVYTSYQQPKYIHEGNYRLDYTYGHDYQRIKSVLKNQGTTVETIYYMGNHERKIKNGVTYDIYYISAGDDLIAMAVKTNGGTEAIYYTYTDYLGSVQGMTDASGMEVLSARQNYDAWGRRRNANFEYTNLLSPPEFMVRGHTGHEMLWQFGLINMNGRIYDPVLARVHSPDNVISTPYHTQGYNRYSYVHNNPLKYTDPDGNIPLLAAALIGAGVGIVSNGINNAMHHRNFFDGAGKAAAFGAISGLVSSGIGALGETIKVGTSALDAAVVQMNLHGISAGLISFAQGGNPVSGFAAGATSSIIGSSITLLGGGASATFFGGTLSGGIGAAISGGNFWQGLQQGLITAGLNHYAHMLDGGGDPVIKPASKLSQPFEPKYTEFEGLGLSLVGLLNEGAQLATFNEKGWYDFRKGKTYSHSFHGNQHTGLRKSSLRYSKNLNYLGKLAGFYGYYNIRSQYATGNMSGFQAGAEFSVNTYSTFGGLYGAAFGVGWELGRFATSTSWYQNWKYKTWLPYRFEKWGY